jgi:hypothetical protein
LIAVTLQPEARCYPDDVWRLAVTVMGFVSAACLLVGGCSPVCGGSCPTATVALRVVSDSAVTWSFQGSPPQTVGVLPDPSSSSDCAFDETSGLIFPVADGGGGTVVGGYFAVRCTGAGAGQFDFVVSRLGDLRNWSAGTFTIVAPAVSVGVDHYSKTAQPVGPAGTACNVSTYLAGLVVTVTVDTATGGPAPYPKLVTDDFVRSFRLDFDTSSVRGTTAAGVPCDFALAAQVSLHLTQTAADYVYDANGPCFCE